MVDAIASCRRVPGLCPSSATCTRWVVTNPTKFYGVWRKSMDPLCSYAWGAVPLVVVSSAEAAEEFLKVQDKAWAGRPPSIAGQIFNNNYKNVIGAPCGPYLRHLRKICTVELLTTKRLDMFLPFRTEEVNYMVRSVYEDSAQGKPVKLIVNLGHLATNNITRMLAN